MPRVLLIHFNSEEAGERLCALSESGFTAEYLDVRSAADLAALRENPPDAFVIDLSRIPSQGRDIGSYLRRQKATRHVPLVFAAGEPDKVARTRALLPDATFTGWDAIREAITQALVRPPVKPVVRDAMAGYSGASLAKKLGIRPGTAVILAGAPDGFAPMLEPLPANVRVKTVLRGQAKLVLLFAKSCRDLEERFPAAARAVEERGGLWIVWPKKASGIASDLGETAVRKFGLDRGFVDYKICAIDETWSGLLFARRRTGA